MDMDYGHAMSPAPERSHTALNEWGRRVAVASIKLPHKAVLRLTYCVTVLPHTYLLYCGHTTVAVLSGEFVNICLL